MEWRADLADLSASSPAGRIVTYREPDEPSKSLPPIPVVFQAIVSPYAKTSEGELIKAVSIPWRRIVNVLVRRPQLAFELSSRTWEEIVAAAFDAAGYDEVTLTPRSGDHGRDVIAVKRGVGSVRVIDSVKAYSHKHLVRYDDVRSLLGVLFADPRATKAILTTTSEFAPGIRKDPLIAPHLPYRLELMNGSELLDWLRDTARQS
jgi:restriction system protein